MNESAEIVLFEKDEHVSFANCGLPYHIGGEIEKRSKLLVATAEFLGRDLKSTCALNTVSLQLIAKTKG